MFVNFESIQNGHLEPMNATKGRFDLTNDKTGLVHSAPYKAALMKRWYIA